MFAPRLRPRSELPGSERALALVRPAAPVQNIPDIQRCRHPRAGHHVRFSSSRRARTGGLRRQGPVVTAVITGVRASLVSVRAHS